MNAYEFKFDERELQVILEALGNEPYNKVFELIGKITEEVLKKQNENATR